MTRKDGGTAFPMQDPQAIHAYAYAKVQRIEDSAERDLAYMDARAEAIGGMSLRDYFAAKALQGFCADPKTSGRSGWEIAEEAYQVADAMLSERAK